ncbi:hypothetical protein CCR94_11660 [Rhodoblastus sphagnicola]|uniref:Uncharacterized protein n=1 Tax=Rhodoblastus sphagnicola TaxID=333368 RepID=A0A2S6N7W6_9HYPH|nr:response regulator [Rhodoblastus sphagnicola]MBB4197820.1 CheY-like chemotaxis protein [Rhodoblastus sphagnicola]PPQ30715.1 hypothetical protein CCR94_11660 [Rhodoblastus sphagnicola]
MSIIVIVDDRSINRTIYAKLAQSIGPDVQARDFGDPAEALNWLAHNRADLIVTDHDMPQIDGDEFITRFRTLPHADSVPVMMITVKDQRLLRLRALESGANDFLHSPIDHCEFVVRARNLLKLAQAVELRGDVASAGTARAPAETARAPVETARARDAGPEAAQKTAPDLEPVEDLAQPPIQTAAPVARLDARRMRAPKRTKPRDWRFALRLDLNTGRVAGAQVLRDGVPADLADPDALRVVLDSAAPLQGLRRAPIRFTLAARLDSKPLAPAALRLPGLLAEARVAPGWLDLRFDAERILAAPDRAEDEARAFAALGAALSVDLGAFSREAGEGALAAPLEQFISSWEPALVFACGAPEEAPRLARGRESVALIAAGVGNAALLTPLRRAGVREAQGACFGAPFAPRDLSNLFPPMENSALKRPA